MRILVVQESDWAEVGPHQSHHLMERLTQRGHEVRVIDFKIRWAESGEKGFVKKRNERMVKPKVVEGSEIRVITPSLLRFPMLDYLSSVYYQNRELNRQMDEFGPDIVVGLGILNARLAIPKCRKRSIPFVYYIIDVLHRLVPQKSMQSIAKVVESSNMKKSSYVLSINGGLHEYALSMGASKERTEIISAGVDLGIYDKAVGSGVREKYKFKENDTVLFFMGWFYRFSGLQETVIQIIEDNGGTIKLLLVGKGDAKADLERMVVENNLEDRVVMVEWVDFNSLPDFIAAVDYCILPAQKNEIMIDIVPIKMYEYLASGKPVIATRLNGLLKEFGEDNGVYFIDGPEGVVNAVRGIQSLGIYDELSDAAKNFTRGLDWSTLTDRFENILKDLTSLTNQADGPI